MKRFILALLCLLCGCNSSVSDAINIAINEPDRKTIDTTRLGVNAFVNDARFGTIDEQFADVKNGIRLNFVRVLFAWTNGVQSAPNAPVNFGFYDEIISSIPDGMDALIVMTGLPTWMGSSDNWIDGDPRKTFVEDFVRKIAKRYSGNGKVIGFQVWNEPNNESDANNTVLDVLNSPSHYLEMLRDSNTIIKSFNPGKLVVSAATTAINQHFPETRDYNRSLIRGGVDLYCDVYGIHVYGRQFENFERSGGVIDTVEEFPKAVWVTESGAQGFEKQLGYGEQMWPYLLGKINNIDRIYQYQYTDNNPAASTYGMRNLTPGSELSDLYVYLRNR